MLNEWKVCSSARIFPRHWLQPSHAPVQAHIGLVMWIVHSRALNPKPEIKLLLSSD